MPTAPAPAPTVSGNIETQSAHISGSYEYQTHFHNHGWRVHSPFTNTAVRNRRGKGGNVTDGSGANRYAYSISAKEVHPADGYDGEQGGSFPAPTGARDEYSYAVSGSVWRSRVIDPQKAPCTANGSCFTDSRTENRQEDWNWRDSGTPTQTPDNRRDDSVRSAYAQEQTGAEGGQYRYGRSPEEITAAARGIRNLWETQGENGSYQSPDGRGHTFDQLAALGRGSLNMDRLVYGSMSALGRQIPAEYKDTYNRAVNHEINEGANFRQAWNRAGRDLAAPNNPNLSTAANTAAKSGAAARGFSAVGNYLGKASGLTPAISTLIPDTVAESVGRTTASARASADRWAGSDPDRQAYVEAGAAISGAALDATWGKGAAKAAKGKKAKHAERSGRHPDSGYPDSGNPAQAYARSAGRYADNIPRGGVSHDFADAYRYRQIGKAAESRFGNPSRFGRNPAEARPKPKTDSPKTRPGKNKTCSFHGSTLVKTHTGYKAIADIKTGDQVLAKNEHTGEISYKTVSAQYSNPYAQTVHIRISDANGKTQILMANTIHPFYANGKWIPSGSLKADDVLLDENGAAQTVLSVETKAEALTAYNLTVADFHTYFVKGAESGADAVWVHNDCDPAAKPDKPKRDLEEIKKQYDDEISDIEATSNYTGREAESRGGLKGALEEYARTGKEVGIKHPSNHIQKTENLLKKAKKVEKRIKNSTLSTADKQKLLDRINQLRQDIEPALNDAIRRRDGK